MKRFRLAAAATIAVAALGGVAVGSLPTGGSSVVTVVDAVDPAGLYNDAQSKFASGDVAGGLAALQKALTLAPADTDALALQAIWADQMDDAAVSNAALGRLRVLNPLLATTARNVISGVATAAQIIPDTTPKPVSGRVAIVVLGFGLNANGKMAPSW
ncbi:hypothetical protein SAMN04488548_1344046 [Gordonia westfalica]|uniref:Tetratricopeptide repeat-containing protein n=1 Tax=Gordonia westfalica TaxID=158898 RepID=A0A1H2KZ12_9ACTN|nr:hypothetical protein SAMN04488548_1344046 [Gordonia westfalica]